MTTHPPPKGSTDDNHSKGLRHEVAVYPGVGSGALTVTEDGGHRYTFRLTDLPDVDGLTEAEREEQDKIDVAAELCDRNTPDELRDLLEPRFPGLPGLSLEPVRTFARATGS